MKKFLSICLIIFSLSGIKTFAQTQYNASTYHQFNTDWGYVKLGAQNSSWAHIYTDRPNFIFNKDIYSY